MLLLSFLIGICNYLRCPSHALLHEITLSVAKNSFKEKLHSNNRTAIITSPVSLTIVTPLCWESRHKSFYSIFYFTQSSPGNKGWRWWMSEGEPSYAVHWLARALSALWEQGQSPQSPAEASSSQEKRKSHFKPVPWFIKEKHFNYLLLVIVQASGSPECTFLSSTRN